MRLLALLAILLFAAGCTTGPTTVCKGCHKRVEATKDCGRCGGTCSCAHCTDCCPCGKKS